MIVLAKSSAAHVAALSYEEYESQNPARKQERPGVIRSGTLKLTTVQVVTNSFVGILRNE
ncbi:MAG: hypothetical protein DMF60_06870 [Acidobacteria bacterium]|nr:MAG: hypothetical protein DMF60_06870 [Acidobacteriota bacterium]